MNRYYFISYIHTRSGAETIYGHCLAEVCDNTLSEILESIRKRNGFDDALTIICLKDLSKEEYSMLKGKEE